MRCEKNIQFSGTTWKLAVAYWLSDILFVQNTAITSYRRPVYKFADINECFVANCVPLLIQQSVDGSTTFFNRSWAEFKVGFNDSIGDYWLGNELLSQLTVSGRYKLNFDLQSRSNTSNWYHAEYSTFRVLTESSNYRLYVAGYSGNAGFDALIYHNGAMFSTYDRDNDQSSSVNCAARQGGGFWHKACANCEVNSPRVGGYDEFSWDGLPGGRLLHSSRMWLQCK